MSERMKGILGAITIVSCLALLAFLVHEKAEGAAIAAVAIVTTLIGWFTRSPEKKDPPAGAAVFAGITAIVASFLACASLPTPQEQSAIAKPTCTLLTAFAGSPTEEALCASAEDLIALESAIRSTRDDAGPLAKFSHKGDCQIVGTVCASDAELASAIRAKRAK